MALLLMGVRYVLQFLRLISIIKRYVVAVWIGCSIDVWAMTTLVAILWCYIVMLYHVVIMSSRCCALVLLCQVVAVARAAVQSS